MLVDLPEEFSGARLSKGVYHGRYFSLTGLDELTWDWDNSQLPYAEAVCRLWTHEMYGGFEDEYEGWIHPQIVQNAYESYGVCDHWSQILTKFRHIQTSVIPYVVRVTVVYKKDQPESGGWRWHKWGPYIGAFRSQADKHEYLYDTPDVEKVFTYEVHEVKYPW